MRLLLDTCTFLWLIGNPSRLSTLAQTLIADPANETWLSFVSIWEMSVKYSLGQLALSAPPETFIPAQRALHKIEVLQLCEAAALYEPKLPRPHRDPFDRMLICQAIIHGLTLLTPDPLINQYPVPTTW